MYPDHDREAARVCRRVDVKIEAHLVGGVRAAAGREVAELRASWWQCAGIEDPWPWLSGDRLLEAKWSRRR